MKYITSFLLVTLFALHLSSCSKDKGDVPEIYDLDFVGTDYTAMIGYNTRIHPHSGNGDFSIMVDDPSVLLATYELPYNPIFINGDIVIEGKRSGTTTVHVKDNVTNQEKHLTVIVTEPSMCFEIMRIQTYVDSDHPEDKDEIGKHLMENYLFASGNNTLYLVKDREQTLYFCEYIKKDREIESYFDKGYYRFAREDGDMYLFLELEKEDVSVKKKYQIEGGTNEGMMLMTSFFELDGINQEKMSVAQTIDTRLSMPDRTSYLVKYKEDVTEQYKESYPGVKEVMVEVIGEVGISTLPLHVFE